MAETCEIAALIDEALVFYKYRDRELDAVGLARLKVGYAEHLHQFAYESLRQVLKNHCRKSTYFPSVKDFIDGIVAINTLVEAVPDVDQAWELARKYARNLYDRAVYEQGVDKLQVHPAVSEVVRNLGHERIVAHTTSEENTLYAQFRDCYQRVIERHQQSQVMLPEYAEHIKQLASQAEPVAVPQLTTAVHETRLSAPRLESPDQSRLRVESEIAERKAARAQRNCSSMLSEESMRFLAKALGKGHNKQSEIEAAHT